MSFHTTYRPLTLDTLIGHEAAVTQFKALATKLKGGGKRNAILITGPSSVGKTTLARALAVEVNGEGGHLDYNEFNVSEARTMDDVREMIRISRLRPRGVKRFIVLDEAQGLIGQQSAQSILKPLEEPVSSVVWILCSMDPEKFGSHKDGKAISNRCLQVSLQPHTRQDLGKFARRIAKAEKMNYVLDEEKKIIKAVVDASAGAMRNVANIMEQLQLFYEGIDGKKPKLLPAEAINSVLETGSNSDETLGAHVLHALYSKNFAKLQTCLLDVAQPWQFMNILLNANSYLLNMEVLGGKRHPKVWASAAARTLIAAKAAPDLKTLALVHECLVLIKCQASSFQVGESHLLTSRLYRCIKDLQALEK